MVFPFEDEPEHDGGKGRRIGINLALHSREPERVGESIDKGAHKSRSLNGNKLAHCHLAPVLQYQLACQMRNAPEQEQYGRRTQQRTHRIHHLCHLRGVACKLREEISREHEERSSRRMAYFQLVAGCNELRTVPEAGCRFNRRAIYESSHQEGKPPQYIVH